MLTHKIDAITGVYDDLHEKMHEIDKTRKNNLMIYGLRPDFLPEIQSQLETKVHEIFKHNLQISREIQTTKIARLLTGPEVRGCRPVVVNFANFRYFHKKKKKINIITQYFFFSGIAKKSSRNPSYSEAQMSTSPKTCLENSENIVTN